MATTMTNLSWEPQKDRDLWGVNLSTFKHEFNSAAGTEVQLFSFKYDRPGGPPEYYVAFVEMRKGPNGIFTASQVHRPEDIEKEIGGKIDLPRAPKEMFGHDDVLGPLSQQQADALHDLAASLAGRRHMVDQTLNAAARLQRAQGHSDWTP